MGKTEEFEPEPTARDELVWLQAVGAVTGRRQTSLDITFKEAGVHTVAQALRLFSNEIASSSVFGFKLGISAVTEYRQPQIQWQAERAEGEVELETLPSYVSLPSMTLRDVLRAILKEKEKRSTQASVDYATHRHVRHPR